MKKKANELASCCPLIFSLELQLERSGFDNFRLFSGHISMIQTISIVNFIKMFNHAKNHIDRSNTFILKQMGSNPICANSFFFQYKSIPIIYLVISDQHNFWHGQTSQQNLQYEWFRSLQGAKEEHKTNKTGPLQFFLWTATKTNPMVPSPVILQ